MTEFINVDDPNRSAVFIDEVKGKLGKWKKIHSIVEVKGGMIKSDFPEFCIGRIQMLKSSELGKQISAEVTSEKIADLAGIELCLVSVKLINKEKPEATETLPMKVILTSIQVRLLQDRINSLN